MPASYGGPYDLFGHGFPVVPSVALHIGIAINRIARYLAIFPRFAAIRTSMNSSAAFASPRFHTTPPKGVHDIRRYEVYSSRTRSTPWAGHRTAWKRCPHLLRLSPLSKAPSPDSEDRTARAESIEHGRRSQGREPPRLSSLWKHNAGSRRHHRPPQGLSPQPLPAGSASTPSLPQPILRIKIAISQ